MRMLLTIPDPRLREKSALVQAIDNPVREIAEFMTSQLELKGVLGFAAPQFGELMRIIVIKRDELSTITIVNPQIVREKGQHYQQEECLSIPDKFFLVKRPKILKVKGLNLEGNEITIKGHGLLAAILRHEIDHLDGIMIDAIGKSIIGR